jgi:hypothetical protein
MQARKDNVTPSDLPNGRAVLDVHFGHLPWQAPQGMREMVGPSEFHIKKTM